MLVSVLEKRSDPTFSNFEKSKDSSEKKVGNTPMYQGKRKKEVPRVGNKRVQLHKSFCSMISYIKAYILLKVLGRALVELRNATKSSQTLQFYNFGRRKISYNEVILLTLDKDD